MRAAAIVVTGIAFSLAPIVACTGTQVSGTTEVEEPIRVESGQFIPGALPGEPPTDASVALPDGGGPPQVTDINVGSGLIAQGERGLVFSGHASANAQSVAVRFSSMGTGYWVVPVGGLDPGENDLPTWQFTADFGRDLTPGLQNLVFSAITPSGASGPQNELQLCVDTPVPDNLSICTTKRVPPAVVLSLSWDAPVELDIVVRTPSGAVIAGNQLGTPSAAATGGVIDRVSNANCVIDDIDRQDIVWQSPPAAGTYEVWVDLFDACHQASVTFTVALWLPETVDGGARHLVQQTALASGVLLAAQANGGSSPGLFVGQFQLR
jgi:hypothetical protein